MKVKIVKARKVDYFDGITCKRVLKKELCGKCGKSIGSKYWNYCPYCGEKIER